MSNTDDRIVNSEGAPFGPILRDMLAVESDRLRASYTAEERDEVLRLATVLTMASDYIAAVVEGKGPRPAATGAEVDRAVAEEREAIAAWHDAEADRITRECAESRRIVRENAAAFVGISTSLEHEEAQAETHRECAAAVRARGVAKPRTGSEAPSASDEGAK